MLRDFAWCEPSEIFAEYAAMTGAENRGSRDLDISAHDTRIASRLRNSRAISMAAAARRESVADTFFCQRAILHA